MHPRPRVSAVLREALKGPRESATLAEKGEACERKLSIRQAHVKERWLGLNERLRIVHVAENASNIQSSRLCWTGCTQWVGSMREEQPDHWSISIKRCSENEVGAALWNRQGRIAPLQSPLHARTRVEQRLRHVNATLDDGIGQRPPSVRVHFRRRAEAQVLQPEVGGGNGIDLDARANKQPCLMR